MSNLKWRNVINDPPNDGQECLTKMKRGIIQGTYMHPTATFEGYYWRLIEWWASEWVPIEEAE